jgi:hypothetical protein
MPNVTGNLSEQIQTTLDIDYIGKRYSIFRGENESLYNFKERIISALTIPGDETELGYSVAIARAFNCVPKVIGYISLENGIYVKSDGNRIIVGTTATNEVFVIESTENYNIKDFKEYLEDNMFGTINLIEDKYLYKNVCFLLPFRNHDNRKNFVGQEGAYYIPDRYIVPESITSASPYVQNNVVDPSSISKVGDYFYNSESRTLITFDTKNGETFQFSFASKWNLVAIMYTPIKVIGISSLMKSSDINNYQNKLNKVIDGFENTNFIQIDSKYKEIFWNALVKDTSIWKANQVSPVSMNGVYYGN